MMDILIKTDRCPVSGIRGMLFLIAVLFLLPDCSSASDTEIPDPEPPGPESPALAPAGGVPRPDRQPGRHGQCRPLL